MRPAAYRLTAVVGCPAKPRYRLRSLLLDVRIGWGEEGKSYVGKNPVGKYRTCVMNDLVHYPRCILCVEIVACQVLE